jgi:hypothetical protein
MIKPAAVAVHCLMGIALSLCLGSQANAQEATEAELAKMAQNPLANLISVPFQNNTNFNIGPYDRTQNVLNIQPVVPFKDGKIITRTIAPVIWQPDVLSPEGTSTGLGDIQFSAFYTPPSDGWMLGVGPVFSFPTGGETRGSQKWGAGASVLAINVGETWVYGGLVNNVWSFAGDEDREDVNMMVLQYFINYNFPDFYLTSSPILTANWVADSGQQWTVPFGLGVGKVFRVGNLPLNCQAHYYYNVEKPDFGAEWTMRFQVQVMLPKPG